PGGLVDRRREHPPCVWDRRRDRVRHGRARRPGAGKRVVVRSERRPVASDLRLRGGHHRRRRFALGNARRRHHPRRRTGGWCPDRPERRRARRPPGIPRCARAPPARFDPCPAGRMIAAVRVTRSRRSALWGLIGAVVVAGAIAVPVSFLVFRLRAEYFAIGTWVVAEVFFLVLIRFRSLGGGTGTSLPGLALIDPVFRQALTYWSALAVAAAALLATYLLLSSRMGLDLTAIRDNEVAARSAGVRVTWA